MFTKQDFQRLSEVKTGPCISIYMPTHRAGEKSLNGHDRIVFKDAVKQAGKELESKFGLAPRELDKTLKELHLLDDNNDFWRHQSDALAVFAGPQGIETFSLPIPMESSSVTVSDQFTLAPAARMLAPGARWYVFAVTQNDNRFFECTRYSATPVIIKDKVPANMEEVLEIYEGGEHVEQRSSNVPGAGGGTITSGQGSNEDRRDERLGFYFRRIGNGITDIIAGQEEPLVIACDPQHAAGIKANIDYPHIIEQTVKTHPSVLDAVAIQRDSWELVQPHFDKSADELQEKFASASGGGNLANGLADVVPAARGGRVAALYVAEEANSRMGSFDVQTNAVSFSDEGSDLLEDAIRHTVATGGQVMFRLAEQVPDTTDGVTAVLRYDY